MVHSIRMVLDSQKRRYMKIGFVFWLAIVISMPLSAAGYTAALLLTFAGFIGFFGIILRMQYGAFRCPKCGVNLFGLLYYPKMTQVFAFPSEYRFCPGCGKNFDETSAAQ